MTNLYLIAHKVRGEPTFDIAEQMACPLCQDEETGTQGCAECDFLGYWWIIPTSGHRAYPWWYWPIWKFSHMVIGWQDTVPPMPEGLPDHYSHSAAPRRSLIEQLGLGRTATPTAPPAPPLPRRL